MNSQNKNIVALIQGTNKGSHEAFLEIFEHLHARVFGYVLSHTPERDDALDITQEAFVDLWKSLKSFRHRSDEEFYGFVFLIVKRKIARFYKTRKITVPLDEEIASEEHEEGREDHRFLMKQIQTLATKYQELLRLRYWGGMKLAEAAAVLGITEGTAKVWHHRALQELKIKVERL